MLFNVFSDAEKFSDLLKVMLTGILPTVRIFGFTILLSIPLGILLAAGRVSKVKILRMPISVYIYLIRSTPLMLQLLFSYFLLSRLEWSPVLRFLFGDKRGSFPIRCIISMFSLNYAAYFAEIFRGGIQSIPVGQREAGQVLGMTRGQTFFHVILPQMAKRVLLPVSNEVITLVKDTSLANVIAVAELFRAAKNEASRTASVEPLFVAGLFYLLMNGAVSLVFSCLNRRMAYYKD